MNEKVSIIIPMYNSEKNVKRCLESVLRQTYENIEVICVNDGSTDKTVNEVEKVRKNDSRIVLINKKNGGVSSARNCGIENATGKFVQFLDADDALEMNATKKMVDMMNANSLDLVMCGFHGFNKSIERSNPKEIVNLKELAEKFLQLYRTSYLNPPWNKMYLRKNIENLFPIDMSLGEDLVFNLKYLDGCKRIGIIPDMEYIYTVGQPDSLTSKYHSNSIDCLESKIKCIFYFLQLTGNEFIFSEMEDDFWKDYKHCIDGMISSGYFSINQLRRRFDEIRNSEMWNKCFSCYIPKDDVSRSFWKGKYYKYILIIKRKVRIQRIKQMVKNILNKIRGS